MNLHHAGRADLTGKVARPGWWRPDGATVARDVGAYVFARTTELVAIMAGTVLLVLLLAAV
jgi:hypothetical protein